MRFHHLTLGKTNAICQSNSIMGQFFLFLVGLSATAPLLDWEIPSRTKSFAASMASGSTQMGTQACQILFVRRACNFLLLVIHNTTPGKSKNWYGTIKSAPECSRIYFSTTVSKGMAHKSNCSTTSFATNSCFRKYPQQQRKAAR
jgi:hypothetical protein